MATSYTATPSTALPGEIVGAPIARLPWVFCCTQGERHCGWAKAANSPREVLEVMGGKRRHEEACNGGLIITAGGFPHRAGP